MGSTVLTQIMSTFKYPAAATQLTEADWTYICAPVFATGLPKAGISRLFPHSVLFGPTLYQGMGVIHPFHFQKLEHLQVILQHGTDDSELDKMIKQSWEAMALEVGVSGPMTSWDFDTLEPSATNCWLKQVWQYILPNKGHPN